MRKSHASLLNDRAIYKVPLVLQNRKAGVLLQLKGKKCHSATAKDGINQCVYLYNLQIIDLSIYTSISISIYISPSNNHLNIVRKTSSLQEQEMRKPNGIVAVMEKQVCSVIIRNIHLQIIYIYLQATANLAHGEKNLLTTRVTRNQKTTWNCGCYGKTCIGCVIIRNINPQIICLCMYVCMYVCIYISHFL
jgi:hypothetical protein